MCPSPSAPLALGERPIGKPTVLARVLTSVPVSKHLAYLGVNGSRMGSDAALSLAGAIRASGSRLALQSFAREKRQEHPWMPLR